MTGMIRGDDGWWCWDDDDRWNDKRWWWWDDDNRWNGMIRLEREMCFFRHRCNSDGFRKVATRWWVCCFDKFRVSAYWSHVLPPRTTTQRGRATRASGNDNRHSCTTGEAFAAKVNCVSVVAIAITKLGFLGPSLTNYAHMPAFCNQENELFPMIPILARIS